MKFFYSIFFYLTFAACLSASISAQTSNTTFDKDGLKFNYPSNWNLNDKSNSDIQHFLLTPTTGNALIVLISPRVRIESTEQFMRIRRSIYGNYFKAITKSLNIDSDSENQNFQCLEINGRRVNGKRFIGSYNNDQSTGEIYSFVLGKRFLSLIYLRTEKDSSMSDPVWQDLIKSLYLDGSNNEASDLFFNSEELSEGMLNNKAI